MTAKLVPGALLLAMLAAGHAGADSLGAAPQQAGPMEYLEVTAEVDKAAAKREEARQRQELEQSLAQQAKKEQLDSLKEGQQQLLESLRLRLDQQQAENERKRREQEAALAAEAEGEAS